LIDEPTSGLDSSTAHSLMQTLKDYAVKEKKTILATIHQPSSQMFYMFDKLLLLSCGRLAYFGDVGAVVPFFSSIGLEISAHYNPADFVMEKVKNTALQEKIINAAKDLSKCPNDNMEDKDDNVLNQSSYREDRNTSSPTLTNESHDLMDNHSNLKAIELHVIIDDQKDLHRIYDKIVCDDDSGRSSWSETDRSSTSTFSSNCSYSDEVCVNLWLSATEQKWPTSFWTQLKVLTKRNFFEARNRMLSKLNWIQTIALAVVAGLIWFQVVRSEDTLNDIRGWMFFSTTYWMLFALFGALISFPSEREVINKERSSGAYRLSSYYLAKMIGELPLTITLPSVFFMISYPMLGFSNTSTFLSLWAFLILSTICAQSVGLFIGAACNDLEVSVTLSALYSLSTMLFAGYYSAQMPPWLSWLRYCSMVYYAFLNMQTVEFINGPPIECSLRISRFSSCKFDNSSDSFGDNIPKVIPFSELFLHLDTMNEGYEPFPIWFNTIVLILFLLTFRLMGYFVLRYLRKPK
jgi:ABC-type multidrug transport system permease subunit